MVGCDLGKGNKSLGGIILGGMMIALAGFLIGGYGGSQLTASFLLNQNLEKDARDVQSQVKILRYMQSGESLQAMELMESRLNRDLVLFDPRKPYEGLTEKTQAGIDTAIQAAKAYRQEYPRDSKNTVDDTMVENLFDKTGG